MRIRSHAPVRIADIGGWTDTWFASLGSVCNVAVGPGIEVTIESDHHNHTGHPVAAGQIVINALGDSYVEEAGSHWSTWRDPLLGALFGAVPGGHRIQIVSGVPSGSGLGSSASLSVAAVAATTALSGGKFSQLDIARIAHERETSIGRQSGVQDHAAAAAGGVRLWDVNYPSFSCRNEVIVPDVLRSLQQCLVTVYLGAPHSSSTVHEMVIAELEDSDDAEAKLGPLRLAAESAAEALFAGDLGGFGQCMVAAHEGQRRLNPGLISDLADHVVSVGALAGARGWKVNGAGGFGGTVTLLSGAGDDERRRICDALANIEEIEMLELQMDSEGVVVHVATDAS